MFKKKDKTVKLLVSCQTCGYTSSQATSCPNCKIELKPESAPASLPVVISNEVQVAKFDDSETVANANPPQTTFSPHRANQLLPLGGTDRPVEYAGFARRAFALAIDQVIILAVQWFCSGLTGSLHCLQQLAWQFYFLAGAYSHGGGAVLDLHCLFRAFALASNTWQIPSRIEGHGFKGKPTHLLAIQLALSNSVLAPFRDVLRFRIRIRFGGQSRIAPRNRQ